MDNIRNIIGCPVAGLSPTELFDASPVARQFTAMFVGDKAFTNLPRKFNVTITGCRDNCIHAETQDLALVPATQLHEGGAKSRLQRPRRWQAGLRWVPHRLPAGCLRASPSEAAELCRAIVLVFRDHGPREARNKARLAFLLETVGNAKFRGGGRADARSSLVPSRPRCAPHRSTDHVGIFRQKERGLNYVGLVGACRAASPVRSSSTSVGWPSATVRVRYG